MSPVVCRPSLLLPLCIQGWRKIVNPPCHCQQCSVLVDLCLLDQSFKSVLIKLVSEENIILILAKTRVVYNLKINCKCTNMRYSAWSVGLRLLALKKFHAITVKMQILHLALFCMRSFDPRLCSM